MKKLFAILFLFLTFFTQLTKAQTLKDSLINFAGEERKISFYIPSDYSSSTPANLLIGLHGLGDNSTNYLNAIINLFPEASIPNTIIFCPDGGSDRIKDFYTPEGDEEIIQKVIDIASNNYNIDPSKITLQGFSLGGRSALRYGLSNYNKFNALLLNTPAVQGVKEAVTGNLFQYGNASQIPIYITCGNQDVVYVPIVDSLNLQLVLNNGKVLYRQFPINHTVPRMSQMDDFHRFVNTLHLSEYDLSVAKVNIPVRSCEANVPFSVIVQNKGSETVSNIKFSYNTEGDTYYYTWTGNLAPFEHFNIDFPEISISDDYYVLTVNVDSLNNNYADTIIFNNQSNADFQVLTQSKTLPYIETFTNTDELEKWAPLPSGDYYMPLTYNPTKKWLYSFNTILIFDNSGQKDAIITPVMDLSSASNPAFTFDIAYKYTSYTSAVINPAMDFADTLEVLISTDCGESYELLYKKGGEDLLTFNEPFIDLLDINLFFNTYPSTNDWRTERIDLSEYAQNTEAIIKFSYTSALGGLIFIDNVSFISEVSINNNDSDKFLVSPNPVSNILNIEMEEVIEVINVYTIQGQLIKQLKPNTNQTFINMEDCISGIYYLDVITSNGKRYNEKIIKN